MINLHQKEPKKVLIVNPFGIGDVLFTTPFISNLKSNFPNLEIDYIGNSRTASLLTNNNKINNNFIYDRDDFILVYKQSKVKFFKKVREFLRSIRNEKYDIVFDFFAE